MTVSIGTYVVHIFGSTYTIFNNNQLYSSLELCSEESNEIVLPTEDTDALERYSVSTNSVPRTIVTIH